jgi:phage virion morphogenesis protein
MIDVQIHGMDQAISTLERVMSPAQKFLMMKVLGQKVKAQTQKRIGTEKTSPDGQRWKPNAPFTVAMKGHGNILIHTGKMMGTITFNAMQSAVEVGSPVIYARQNQEGAAGGRKYKGRTMGPVPARPFIGISNPNGTEIEQIMVGFVARQFM